MRTIKILALSTLVVGFMATSAIAGNCGDKSADTAAAKAKTEAQVAKAGDCAKGASTASATKTASAAGCDKSASTASAVKTASAGGCDKSASTASATKTASAAGCDSKASTAAATKTASAGGCDKSASTASAVKTASAGGCDKSASTASAVKTASAGGCDKSASTASATKVAGAGCASSATKTASAGNCSSDAKGAKMAVKLETVRMPSGAMVVMYHGKDASSVAALQASAKNGCQGFACDLAKSVAADENCKVEMAKTDTGVMMIVTSEKAEALDGYEAQYAAVIASADGAQGE